MRLTSGDYHSESHDLPVDPVLVYTDRPGVRDETDGVTPHRPGSPARDAQRPRRLRRASTAPRISRSGFWGRRALPSLVGAAKRIFRDEPLPAIKRAESAGIPELLTWLHSLAGDAQRNGERHLVLVSGVPGSGKTLVGLQFVYEHGTDEARSAVLYSGNDPLVQVLQHVLGSTVFVRRWQRLRPAVRGRRDCPITTCSCSMMLSELGIVIECRAQAD